MHRKGARSVRKGEWLATDVGNGEPRTVLNLQVLTDLEVVSQWGRIPSLPSGFSHRQD